MSKLSSALIALLILLLIAYGAYDFYQNFEYKEKTIHTGYKGEARKNPYYASRLFLKRMGIPTETKNSLQDFGALPDTDTLLIITTRRSTLSPQRTQKLIDWVKSGGQLIALATSNWKYNGSENELEEDYNPEKWDKKWDSPDPLQRYMGVRKAPKNTFEKIIEKVGIEAEVEIEADDKEKVYSIKLQGSDKPLKLNDSWFRPLFVDEEHKSQTEEIKLNQQNYIVRQKVGNGLITLVTDMNFFKNTKIELQDHAEILWQLVHGLHHSINSPKRIWLIHNDKMRPLWKILWQNYWAFLISLSLLLVFWLFKISQRFGPMIPKEEENRRSLNEHITSSGYFYWKNNKKQALIESSRKALAQRLARVHPGWTQYSEEQQIKLLAEQLSIKPEAIQKLLHAENIEQADEFTQLIKQIEEIRKAL